MRRELLQIVPEREECIQELKDQIARLKGEKGKPLIWPSRLEPKEKGHFGSHLRSYLLYQDHHCRVTQPLQVEQMHEWGIEISAAQLNRILVEDKQGREQTRP